MRPWQKHRDKTENACILLFGSHTHRNVEVEKSAYKQGRGHQHPFSQRCQQQQILSWCQRQRRRLGSEKVLLFAEGAASAWSSNNFGRSGADFGPLLECKRRRTFPGRFHGPIPTTWPAPKHGGLPGCRRSSNQGRQAGHLPRDHRNPLGVAQCARKQPPTCPLRPIHNGFSPDISSGLLWRVPWERTPENGLDRDKRLETKRLGVPTRST